MNAKTARALASELFDDDVMWRFDMDYNVKSGDNSMLIYVRDDNGTVHIFDTEIITHAIVLNNAVKITRRQQRDSGGAQ